MVDYPTSSWSSLKATSFQYPGNLMHVGQPFPPPASEWNCYFGTMAQNPGPELQPSEHDLQPDEMPEEYEYSETYDSEEDEIYEDDDYELDEDDFVPEAYSPRVNDNTNARQRSLAKQKFESGVDNSAVNSRHSLARKGLIKMLKAHQWKDHKLAKTQARWNR
ncbi:MAG: hypothetical protein M1821_003544 [Bathelium mastoideum]|nr:MAG: hypothetical protein M1821_003544 [Bathelium mastoideum]KAI9682631.1 MAG: hypothetical protein M1822_006929 [Bathelium mastoideum]